MPLTVRRVPRISNRLSDSILKRSLSVESLGIVKTPMTVKARNTSAINQKEARHPNKSVAMPPASVPKTNPSGFPPEKHFSSVSMQANYT